MRGLLLLACVAGLTGCAAGYDPGLIPPRVDDYAIAPRILCPGDAIVARWATRDAEDVRLELDDGSAITGLPATGMRTLPAAIAGATLAVRRGARTVTRELAARRLAADDMVDIGGPTTACLGERQITEVRLDPDAVSARVRVHSLSNPFMMPLLVTYVSPGGARLERELGAGEVVPTFDGRAIAGTWTFSRPLPAASCGRPGLELRVLVQTRCDP